MQRHMEDIKLSYESKLHLMLLTHVGEKFTSVVVLIHSLEPTNIIMSVRNQMDVQHGWLCGWT